MTQEQSRTKENVQSNNTGFLNTGGRYKGLLGWIFSLLTFLVAIPSAVKVFNWVATLYKGSIKLEPPLVEGGPYGPYGPFDQNGGSHD